MSDLLFNAILCGDIDYLKSFHSIHQLGRKKTDTSSSSFNELFPSGCAPLNVAIANRRYEIVRFLLDHGANVDLADSFRVDGCERKAIHYACRNGTVELVKELVELHDVDPEVRDCGNSPPVHHAASSGNTDIVEYLVSIGCDINAQSNSGRTALWKAACAGHREILHILYALGAQVNVQSQVGETVLFECVRKFDLLEVVSDLLSFGANVNVRDIESNTALHSAAMSGNVLAGEMLADAGAPTNAGNEYGNTPLHNAILYGQIAFAVFLVNRGARCNVENKSQQTPFYTALLHARQDGVEFLRQAGYRPSGDELRSFGQYEAHKTEKKRGVFRSAVRLFRTPLSLSSLCRVVVRGNVVLPSRDVPRLTLPVAVQNFLLMNEFINI